jgi:hypothetical protein
MDRPTSRFLRLAAASLAVIAGSAVWPGASATPIAQALDNTPWVLPYTPPRCTAQKVETGDVAGCVITFYDDPSATGWGLPPAPGVGDGWKWSGYWYNGSPALAAWESTYIAANTAPVAGLRAGVLRTHVGVRALFEGFLDEVSANGYRIRDASGYSFRCTDGNGGWSCPSGDPDDLSNHAWGLAIDLNAGSNPIKSYTSVNGQTACMTPIQTDLPQWVIQTAEKWGLYWGGYGWNSGCQSLTTQRTVVSRDPPHFEFRGTPRQAAAIAAFNLANDPSIVCRTVVDDSGKDVQQCGRSLPMPAAGVRLPVQLTPPAGATAAMINLTATEAAAPGFLTLEDCGARSGARTTSALTYATGQSVAAMAIVPISSAGRFCIYRSSAVHTVVDITAYLGSSGQRLWYQASAPTRLTDTREVGVCQPGQACTPGQLPSFTKQSVPTSSNDARIVNLTVVDARGPGWFQVGRCADVGPDGKFSNLNVSDAGARANMALVPAGDTGTCGLGMTQANIVVDELGKLSASDGYGWQLAPARRVIDTRECTDQWCDGRPGAGAIVHVGLGTSSPAAAIAVTVTDTAAAGFVTVGRCADLEGATQMQTSNVNYGPGVTTTGLAIVSADQGEICAYTLSPAHLVIDVQAELTTEHSIGVIPVTPKRVHDSRTV